MAIGDNRTSDHEYPTENPVDHEHNRTCHAPPVVSTHLASSVCSLCCCFRRLGLTIERCVRQDVHRFGHRSFIIIIRIIGPLGVLLGSSDPWASSSWPMRHPLVSTCSVQSSRNSRVLFDSLAEVRTRGSLKLIIAREYGEGFMRFKLLVSFVGFHFLILHGELSSRVGGTARGTPQNGRYTSRAVRNVFWARRPLSPLGQ